MRLWLFSELYFLRCDFFYEEGKQSHWSSKKNQLILETKKINGLSSVFPLLLAELRGNSENFSYQGSFLLSFEIVTPYSLSDVLCYHGKKDINNPFPNVTCVWPMVLLLLMGLFILVKRYVALRVEFSNTTKI